MKQHITIEQLNELSDPSKEKLKKWYDNTYGITLYGESFPGQELINPLLSIGQMIEFLDEKLNRALWLEILSDWEIESQDLWDRSKNKKTLELVDILWNEVKEILESK